MAVMFGNNVFHYAVPKGMEPRQWHRECQTAFIDKWRSHVGGDFTFLVGAGAGSGKTFLSAFIASELLNRRLVERVVYVCPNRIILGTAQSTFSRFGIILPEWEKSRHGHDGAEGETAGQQGLIMTYQALAQHRCATANHSLATRRPTLAIFDEIHHLGDKKQWAKSAQYAFEGVAPVLGLSGTPFRADKRRMPFVNYREGSSSEIHYLECDFEYTLGRAIVDSVCKRPVFHWLDATVEIDKGCGPVTYNRSNPPPPDDAAIYLRSAVRHNSQSRRDAIRHAVQVCKQERRPLIIFVGGSSRSPERAIEEADLLVPKELESLGVPPSEVVSITSESGMVDAKIDAIRSGRAWILVTVNMVSEGVDIPELSAALFLTTVTTTASLIQRLGRCGRGCTPPQSLIFMFRHPAHVEVAEKIEGEIDREARLKTPRASTGEGRSGGQPKLVIGRGIQAVPDGLTFNGTTYSASQVDAARASLTRRRMPSDPVKARAYLESELMHLFGVNDPWKS